MEVLINRVVAATGLNAGTIGDALTAILAFLVKEGPREEVDRLLDAIPGAQEALANVGPSASPSSGGLGAGLLGMLGGGGGVMALGQQLMSLGVPMNQMQPLGHELLAYGRETAGDEVVTTIIDSVPGLSQLA